MLRSIVDKEHGLLVCMGNKEEYEAFKEILNSFESTPPYRHDILSMQTEEETQFTYRDTAKALGMRPVFILEGFGVEWSEIERIASEFKERGYKTIEDTAKEELIKMGKSPEHDYDISWESDRDYRIERLVGEEVKRDIKRTKVEV